MDYRFLNSSCKEISYDLWLSSFVKVTCFVFLFLCFSTEFRNKQQWPSLFEWNECQSTIIPKHRWNVICKTQGDRREISVSQEDVSPLWSKSSGLVEFSLISSNCDKTHQVISASLICLMQSTRLSFHQMYCVLSPHTYSCSQKLSYWHTQQVGELMAGYRISGEWKVTAVLSSWNLWKGEVWIVFWF